MAALHETISPTQRLLITIAVMSATLMQIIDMTIINVALPHMQGSLSTTPDEISWTLTSYLVASGIFMPLTGYFSDRLGRKKYLLISIAGFTVASIFCGAAVSLTEIVVFRLLQGIFGAALVPLSQAIMADIYPEVDRGKAMAIWGMGVMIGPILGPTLGGYLTEIASWRWTFYVNVPIGILAFLLAMEVVPDSEKKERFMDWIGLTLLSVAIAALQYVLDRGDRRDWFDAIDIRIATFLTIAGFIGFLWHSIHEKQKSVFDLRIFKDRNFTIASLLLAVMGLGMFGAMVIQPMMLEGILDYPVLTTGLVMAPRGISGMISMILVGKLISRVDPRWLILTGIIISAAGISIGTHYSQNISPIWVIAPLLLQGFGLSMIFVPLSTVAFSTLPISMRVEAAGLFSLLRTLGASIGIAVTITIYTRHAQFAWNQIGGFIQPFNPALQTYLNAAHLKLSDPTTIAILMNQLRQQAQMVSFVDVYAFITWSFIAMIPLVFFLKKRKVVSVPTMPASALPPNE